LGTAAQLTRISGRSPRWLAVWMARDQFLAGAGFAGDEHRRIGGRDQPLIYRFYEVVGVYGETIKALVHEEFGDGIMSAIDYSMDIQRQPDPKGDRVVVTLNGKFLPYKSW
jgi:hypothetical protein